MTGFEYDAAGNITKVTNAEGRERSYEYNESGKVTKITDFDGSITIREYNALNKPSKVTDQLGRETLLTYDAMWNLARVTQPDGSRTTYLYDEHNRLGRIRNANGDVVRYTYDANGNRTGVEDEEGNRTIFTYGALGRLTAVTDAEGGRISYSYDAEGNLTEVTDALGGKVSMEYDAAGNLIKETNQAGESRSYTYTSLGKTAGITNEAGLVTSFVYELGGQLKEIIHPDGSKESYVHDANGNITEYTDRRGYHLTYEYDSLDRMVEVKGSDEAKKCYEYDSVGNVTKITDALGNKTTYEYSLTGKLVKVIDALGNRTEYDYDDKDQLLEIRQYGEFEGESAGAAVPETSESIKAACQVTRYERNPLGQITKVTDPLGRTESFTYNRRGELISRLDKEGYLTKYGYTSKGDVNHIRYADGREVKLSYNPLRQLQEIEDWLGITRIETDQVGSAIKVTGADGKEVSYEYDTAGRRTGITYPDNTKAEYKYDAFGRLAELVQGEKSITYGYDAAGYLSQKTYSNGMETAYDYTARGQIAGLIHSDAEGVLDEYSYGYDLLGNKTSIEKRRRGLENESGVYSYGYDATGRLESVSKDGNALRSYSYDAFGNRTSLTEAGGVTRYAYNALNQLVRKTFIAQDTDNVQNQTSYHYDKRGNLQLVLENGLIKNEYVYGAINRLEEARNAQGEVSRYIYNGLGHRVGKETGKIQPENLSLSAVENALDPVKKLESLNFNPSSRIDYVIDITKGYHNLLQKCEDNNTQTYLWDGNVAGMLDEGSDAQSYYLQDEMGSPIRLMDETGSLRETYGYDEFGQDLYGNQGISQPFGYTGYQADAVTGTYFAQAREYRAGEGRFGGEDLIKGSIDMPFTLNHYGYCWGNPMILVDLDGAWPTSEDLEDIWSEIGEGVFNVYDNVVDGYNSLTQDLQGTATIKLSGNATLMFGIYGDIGISFDWKGNVAIQGTYSVPGVDNTASVGLWDIGGAVGLAFTNAEDVDGLLGKASAIGASGGYLGYGSIDVLSFDELDTVNGDIDGL